MTLANKITVLRIITVPILVIAVIQGERLLAQILFAACALTDALDGTLARLRGERTPLGTFLDPLADKLLLTATLLVLTGIGEIPLWVFIAVISRDLLIVLGWGLVFILTGNKKIEPRPLGKVTTALQMVYTVTVLFGMPPDIRVLALGLMMTATCLSAIDYVWIGNRRLGELK